MSSVFSGFYLSQVQDRGLDQRSLFPTQGLLMAEESESAVLHLGSEAAESAGLELTQVPVLCQVINMPYIHLYRKALATCTSVLLLTRYNGSPSGLWDIPAEVEDFHEGLGSCRDKTFPQRLFLISDTAKHYLATCSQTWLESFLPVCLYLAASARPLTMTPFNQKCTSHNAQCIWALTEVLQHGFAYVRHTLKEPCRRHWALKDLK